MSDTAVHEENAPPPAEEGAPLWTVTFGDMMSLLLTFFILLFSMSELKMDKFLLASQSLREAMGGTAAEAIVDPMGLMPDPVDPDLQMQNPGLSQGASESPDNGMAGGARIGQMSVAEMIAEEYMKGMVEQLTSLVEENDLQDRLTLTIGADGVRIRVQAAALFQPGDAIVAAGSMWLLDSLAHLTGEVEVPVIVAGHADNQPIGNSRFASNWELSAARAAGVARRFVDNGRDPEQLRVEAFGEYRPVATNATREGRATNRRVELFYSRQAVIESVTRWRGEMGADDD